VAAQIMQLAVRIPVYWLVVWLFVLLLQDPVWTR